MEERRPVIRIEPGRVAWRRFGDEMVLLDLQDSRYLSTNDTASLLWQRLESGTTREDLIEALLDEYDVTKDTAAADVDEFLAGCRARGLLEEG